MTALEPALYRRNNEPHLADEAARTSWQVPKSPAAPPRRQVVTPATSCSTRSLGQTAGPARTSAPASFADSHRSGTVAGQAPSSSRLPHSEIAERPREPHR